MPSLVSLSMSSRLQCCACMRRSVLRLPACLCSQKEISPGTTSDRKSHTLSG